MFLRECGMVNAGDVGPTRAISADCWGAERAQYDFLFTEDDWGEIYAAMRALSTGTDDDHPAADEQIDTIRQCLESQE